MTERLYFDDPYLTTFTASVVARTERGGLQAVALDRTAFYPEGGGQPSDRGTLGGVPVVDVQAEDEVVWHHLADPLEGDLVAGIVDWSRRFDHMQQHSGQHLLSAAFEELLARPTVAFHLGAQYSSIDLPGEISETEARGVEARVNDVIWQDRPISARIVSPEELAAIPLRKPPTVSGPVRVVSVPAFDHSACGGTHPRSTGAVGILFIPRLERRGRETRVEFLCGGRALTHLRTTSGTLRDLATALSVGAAEVPDAVARIRDQEAASRKRLGIVVTRLLEHESRALVDQAPRIGRAAVPFVVAMPEGLAATDARQLASGVVARGGVVLLGLSGEKPLLLIGRADGIPLDAGAIVRQAVGPLGGKGGGQPGLAQGGLPDDDRLDQAMKTARAAIETALVPDPDDAPGQR